MDVPQELPRDLSPMLLWDLMHVRDFEAKLDLSSDGKISSEGMLYVFSGFVTAAVDKLSEFLGVKVDQTLSPEHQGRQSDVVMYCVGCKAGWRSRGLCAVGQPFLMPSQCGSLLCKQLMTYFLFGEIAMFGCWPHLHLLATNSFEGACCMGLRFCLSAGLCASKVVYSHCVF
jgi:hypothetical protein